MRKILFILALLPLFGFGQTINEVFYPGKTIYTNALDSVAGDNTYVYFAFKQTVHAYSIQIDVYDTIEGVAGGAYLQGGNVVGGLYAAIGDSLILTKDVADFTTIRAWTGTSAPYGHYRIKISDALLTEGRVKITIGYN